MTNPNTRRNDSIVARYKSGHSLREIARYFNLSHERIRAIVKRLDPTAMRPKNIGMNFEASQRRKINAR